MKDNVWKWISTALAGMLVTAIVLSFGIGRSVAVKADIAEVKVEMNEKLDSISEQITNINTRDIEDIKNQLVQMNQQMAQTHLLLETYGISFQRLRDERETGDE